MTHNNYEYFEVTADIGVRIWGHGINELFENAALAVTSLMIDPTHIGKIIHRNIQVDGNNLSSLLINWITELLIIRDSEGILFSSFKINVSKNGKRLKAEAWGNHIVGENIEMDIKAITYSLFKLEKINDEYCLQFVLDI